MSSKANKASYVQLIKSKGFIIVILAIIFYGLLTAYSDFQSIYLLRDVNGFTIVPILLSFGASICIKIIRQYFLLRKLGIVLSFKENISIYLASLSFTITPGSVGHVVKSYSLLKDHSQPVAKTVPVVIAERYYDAAAMTIFILSFSLFSSYAIDNPILIFSIVFGLILITCLVLIRIGVLPKIAKAMFASRFGIIRTISNLLHISNLTLDSLSSSKKSMFIMLVISLVAWLSEAIGVYLCFEAFKINLSFFTVSLYNFSSILLGAVSLLPAGIGVTEITFVNLLATQGIGIAESTAVVLLIRLCSIWFSTFIGVITIRVIGLKNKKKE